MERTSRAYKGEKTVTKDFDLTLNLDTSANPPTLVGCATGGGELIAMCNALGGTWGGGSVPWRHLRVPSRLPDPVVQGKR